MSTVIWVFILATAGTLLALALLLAPVAISRAIVNWRWKGLNDLDKREAEIEQHQIIIKTLAGVVGVISVGIALYQAVQAESDRKESVALQQIDTATELLNDNDQNNDRAAYKGLAFAASLHDTLGQQVARILADELLTLNPDTQPPRCRYRYQTVNGQRPEDIRAFDAEADARACKDRESCFEPNKTAMRNTEAALAALGSARHDLPEDSRPQLKAKQLSTNGPKFLDRPNFSNLDMLGSDFCGAQFNGASFDNSILNAAQFVNSEFEDVSFVGASLSNADFHNAAFYGKADFSGAQGLDSASFTCACSENGNLQGHDGEEFLASRVPISAAQCRVNNGINVSYFKAGSNQIARSEVFSPSGSGEPIYGEHLFVCR